MKLFKFQKNIAQKNWTEGTQKVFTEAEAAFQQKLQICHMILIFPLPLDKYIATSELWETVQGNNAIH